MWNSVFAICTQNSQKMFPSNKYIKIKDSWFFLKSVLILFKFYFSLLSTLVSSSYLASYLGLSLPSNYLSTHEEQKAVAVAQK